MPHTLDHMRHQIDAIDQHLLLLLKARLELAVEIGRRKRLLGEPVRQPEREREIYQTRRRQALELTLDPDFVESLWHQIHEESCRIQGAGEAASSVRDTDGR